MPRNKHPKSCEAFTLIELLIVIAIIAILAGLLLPAAMRLITHSNEKSARAEMEGVRAALDEYYEDYGQFPYANSIGGTKVNTSQGIANSDLEDKYECQMYLEGASSQKEWIDPFGTEYYYTLKPTYTDVQKGKPYLASLGADGAPGESGVDDDGNSTDDDNSEIGWKNTDDIVVK